MKFNEVLNEISSYDVVGTENPHFVDWASGKGPETDLSKRAKKKKKIVKKKIFSTITKI